MAHSALVRRSKRNAIIAGVLWIFVFVANLLFAAFTGQLENTSPPLETLDKRTLAMAATFYLPFIFMMLSVLGMHQRYQDQWKMVGTSGLVLSLIGLSLVPVTGAIGITGTPQEFEPSAIGELGIQLAILGSIVLGTGLVLMGIGALWSRIPSRLFGVIVIGVGLFQFLVLLVSQLRVFGYSLGWIVLGLALQKIPKGPSVSGKSSD